MGLFSRSSKPPKVPRWGFRTGWEDFLVEVRTVARTYGLTIDDAIFYGEGVAELPEDATYSAIDLRPVAAACRDLDPHHWGGVIRKTFVEMYGREGDIEVLEDAGDAPQQRQPNQAGVEQQKKKPRSGATNSTAIVTSPATTLPERLRVQVFGKDYISMLAKDKVAMRPMGDAYAVLTQDIFNSSETTLTWEDLELAGLDVDAAFSLGIENGARATLHDVQTFGADLPNAKAEIFVSNQFYLSAMLMMSHAMLPPETAVVACAISWHHWVFATLGEGADRETLVAMRKLVDGLLEAVKVPPSEWIGTSLWWWPVGKAPEVIPVDGELPASLAARFAT